MKAKRNTSSRGGRPTPAMTGWRSLSGPCLLLAASVLQAAPTLQVVFPVADADVQLGEPLPALPHRPLLPGSPEHL